MLADEFRRNVQDYLKLMCNGALEQRAVEEFCQMPGGYRRIMEFLDRSGVRLDEVSNLLAISERTKAVFHRMKNQAMERYNRDQFLRERRYSA
jgi:hypothetical protein